MAEEQEWYHLSGEEQLGPVSPEELLQLAAEGQILPETQLWTEGLEEWVQAAQVEGLFPEPVVEPPHPHLVVGAEAQTAHPLAGEILPGQHAAPLNPYTAGHPQHHQGHEPASPPGEAYPTVGPIKASFGWLVTLPILAFLGFGGAIAFLVLRAHSISEPSPENMDVVSFALEMLGITLSATAFFCLCFVLFIVLKMIVLHRAWRTVQFGGARTTPGKAVGFLFIPFFKFYWLFVAYLGLAKDWNRTHNTHPNLVGAPALSEGLTLTYCIITLIHKVVWWILFFTNMGNNEGSNTAGIVLLVLFLLALIFELIFLAGVCRLVNFMGRLHIRQTQPQRTGLQFY